MKKVALALLALGAALTVALPGAFARTEAAAKPEAVPGVTNRSITIGGTFPFSGPVSAYAPIARGMEAYFKYINARRDRRTGQRGVYGRQIIFKQYDDGYNPANAIQLTNKLVLEDKVFAVVASLGTEVNLAIRPMLNQRKIPQVNVLTGASFWGTQYKQYPWTIGWVLDYVAEANMLAKWILANTARQKIAVFYQNDDYGKDYLRGIKARPRRCRSGQDRLGAELRGDGRELRVADRGAAAVGRRHLDPVHDRRDSDGAGTRHGGPDRLEAGPDHHQRRGRHRPGDGRGCPADRAGLRQRHDQHRVT